MVKGHYSCGGLFVALCGINDESMWYDIKLDQNMSHNLETGFPKYHF